MEVVIIEKRAFEKIVSEVLALAKKIDTLSGMDERKYDGAWLDSEDVCRRLQISPRRLQTLRTTRKIICAQIGRKFYYRTEEVEAFLQAHKQETPKT